MKKFNKITAVIMVLSIFSFCSCVQAVKFDKIDVVRADVENSVRRVKNVSMVAVCETKIDALRELLLRCSVCAKIRELAGTYMEKCGIAQKSYTAEQLKRSGNIGDFKYNVEQIINVYRAIKEEYAGCSASSLEAPVDTHTSRQYLSKCRQRKGEYSTSGRSGRGNFR